jgi:methylthioribulose-1-phosphate dehydratase
MAIHTLTHDDEDNLEFMVSLIRQMHARQESPATSGNYSFRPEKSEGDFFMLSESAVDKSIFGRDNFIGVSEKGEVLPLWEKAGREASAETKLHLVIYERTNAHCVLHSHGLDSVFFAEAFPGQDVAYVKGLELLKGLSGVTSHEETFHIPIFENSQDMGKLCKKLNDYLDKNPQCFGFVLRGHGLTCWGKSVWEAKRHLEVYRYLFEYFTHKAK